MHQRPAPRGAGASKPRAVQLPLAAFVGGWRGSWRAAQRRHAWHAWFFELIRDATARGDGVCSLSFLE